MVAMFKVNTGQSPSWHINPLHLSLHFVSIQNDNRTIEHGPATWNPRSLQSCFSKKGLPRTPRTFLFPKPCVFSLLSYPCLVAASDIPWGQVRVSSWTALNMVTYTLWQFHARGGEKESRVHSHLDTGTEAWRFSDVTTTAWVRVMETRN